MILILFIIYVVIYLPIIVVYTVYILMLWQHCDMLHSHANKAHLNWIELNWIERETETERQRERERDRERERERERRERRERSVWVNEEESEWMQEGEGERRRTHLNWWDAEIRSKLNDTLLSSKVPIRTKDVSKPGATFSSSQKPSTITALKKPDSTDLKNLSNETSRTKDSCMTNNQHATNPFS